MSRNNDVRLYSTGEIADATGVTVRTVQYYDQKGLLHPTERSEGGRRLYDDAALNRMKTIVTLKSLGLPLKAVRGVLESEASNEVLRCLLQEQKKTLERQIADDLETLKAVRRALGESARDSAVLSETERGASAPVGADPGATGNAAPVGADSRAAGNAAAPGGADSGASGNAVSGGAELGAAGTDAMPDEIMPGAIGWNRVKSGEADPGAAGDAAAPTEGESDVAGNAAKSGGIESVAAGCAAAAPGEVEPGERDSQREKSGPASVQDKSSSMLQHRENKSGMEHNMSKLFARKDTKLYAVQRRMLAEGIVVDVIEVVCVVIGIMTGNWLPLAVALPLIIIVAAELVKAYYQEARYVCPHCHATFQPTMRQFMWSTHTPKTRKLTCANCGTKDWCVEVAAE